MTTDTSLPPVVAFDPIHAFDPAPTKPVAAMLNKQATIFQAELNKPELRGNSFANANQERWATLLSELRAAPVDPPSTVIRQPMLTTEWNQHAPYNLLCPNGSHYAERSITGCVAVAISQVMKYHEWPVAGNGTMTYSDTKGAVTAKMFADYSFPYHWDQIADDYSTTASIVSALPLARLLVETGTLIGADYELSETSAYSSNIYNLMAQYLGYATGKYGDSRSGNVGYVDQATLFSRIRADMVEGRPAIVSFDGHSFIADGLGTAEDLDYYHFNYGWGGGYNGWYLLTDGADGTIIVSATTNLMPNPIPVFDSISVEQSASFTISWKFPKRLTAQAFRLKNGTAVISDAIDGDALSYALTDQSGTNTYTLEAMVDGEWQTPSEPITITVKDSPVDLPAITVDKELTSIGGEPATAIVSSTNELQSLTITSNRPDLLPENGIVISGDGTTRTISLTPKAGMVGNVLLYLTADDTAGNCVKEILCLKVMADEPLNWHTTLDEAVASAEVNGKLILMVAGPENDHYTNDFRSTVCEIPEIKASLLENFELWYCNDLNGTAICWDFINYQGGDVAIPFLAVIAPEDVAARKSLRYHLGPMDDELAHIFLSQVATPTLSADSVEYFLESITVTANCETPDATLRYTTDGATPDEESPSFPADGLVVTDNTTLTVRAFYDGIWPSDTVVSKLFVLKEFLSATEVVSGEGITIYSGGDAPWFLQEDIFNSSPSAMQSGAIGHNETTTLIAKVMGEGELTFCWKASSQRNYDLLSFAIDGETKDSISGKTDWIGKSYEISGAGEHCLKWTYAKDKKNISNQDCAWLDDISWIPAEHPIFEFHVTDNAIFETEEEISLTISADDPSYFEAAAWDVASYSLIPTTNVEFVNATLAEPAAGDITVVDGELGFTPAMNWNGEVTVSAVVHCTTIVNTETSVEFTISVTPVVDPLELTLVSNDLTAVEGEPLGGTLTFTATDVEGGRFLESATFTLEGFDAELDGTLTYGETIEGVTTYTFIPETNVIPYTTVCHPSTSETYALPLMATGGDTECALEDSLAVTDCDQLVAITSFTVNGETASLTVKADTELTVIGIAEDPDPEDEVTLETYWSTDGEHWSAEQPTLVKDAAIYVYGVAKSSFGDFEADSEVIAINVLNSAPEVPVTYGDVFVLRNLDGSTPEPGLVNFIAVDADGWDDLRVCHLVPIRAVIPSIDTTATVYGIYGTAEVVIADGGTITFTYTMNETTVAANEDTEEELIFYVTDVNEEDFIPVTVKCTFQGNPSPVLATDSQTITVTEVDAESNPTAFALTATATDSIFYPAGVSAWSITVPEGWIAELVSADTGSVDAGTWEGTATWTITTAGYETISGIPHKTSGEFAMTVRATDALSARESSLDFSITVEDSDHLPSAPETVTLSPATPRHGDAVVATATGGTDADGDEIIGYAYAWSYSTDGENFTALDETSDTLTAAEAIKKGCTVKVAAFTVTNPYGDADATSAESLEATVVVGNTAPYFSALGDQTAVDATENLEFTWTVAENSSGNTMCTTATDVDAEDGVDSLTYAVSEIDEGIGTLAIDAATGEITFTPAPDYNTIETGDTVGFTVTVTDEDGATAVNTATVTLVITEVNTAPILAIEDQEIIVEDLGKELSVRVTATMGENEDAQELSAANVEVIEDVDDIFATAPTATFSGKDVTLTYTIKSDTPIGSTAKVKTTIQDNGTTGGMADPQESTCEFTITVVNTCIVKIPLAHGWNLVGIPFELTDASVAKLAEYTTLGYNAKIQCFLLGVPLLPGCAVWLYEPAENPEPLVLKGISPESTVVTLVPGWNLVSPLYGTDGLACPEGIREGWHWRDGTEKRLSSDELAIPGEGYWLNSPAAQVIWE